MSAVVTKVRLSEQQFALLEMAEAGKWAPRVARIYGRHLARTANSLEAMALGKVFWASGWRVFEINDAGQKALEAHR